MISHRSGPLRGVVTVPGDKSISHRALMLGSLATGETRITGLLEGEDVLRTAAAMRALGATVTRDAPGAWRVSGRGVGGLREPECVLDMGNSGTAARLLCGLLATHDVFAVMTGDESLCRRPMARVIAPLSACGAVFDSRAGGRMPLAIRGARDPLPLDYDVPVPSAQVKSAILLAGLNARGDTVVTERVATRDHTETMLRHFGADIRTDGDRITLRGHPELFARDVAVPADPSSAAFPLVAATLVPGSEVTLLGVAQNPGRIGLFMTLREMGAAVTLANARAAGGGPVADMTVCHAPLRGVEVPESRAASMIDEFPILAVAACCAHGETRMRGLAELRVKESDRLAATAAMIAQAGGRVRIEADDLIVTGAGSPPPGGATIATHMDHRLAMSALVLGLVTADPVAVDDARFIDTSFPGFTDLMRALGADLR